MDWDHAYRALSEADREEGLDADELERLATAAYMLGRETEQLRLLERAHRARLGEGAPLAALRDAIWLTIGHGRRGEAGQAAGWLARAERILEREGAERVEGGYLLLPLAFEREARGEREAALATLEQAAAIGERFGDADLLCLAMHERGHLLVEAGAQAEGLRLLDEAMVPVTAGELSPIVSGIVYCGVVLACRKAFEVPRAREWTAALSRWCEGQSGLVSFTGNCLVHRAELMQLGGDLDGALAEAELACARCLMSGGALGAGEACYRKGEVLRLRGSFEAAEAAYRDALGHGRDPQPGLALLRLAQEKTDAAAAASRRALAEEAEPGRRLAFLPAQVEIMLAAGDPAAADEARLALETAAEGRTGMLAALAAEARGRVALAAGKPDAALAALRAALGTWTELGAPYEAASARELLAHASRLLGDEDGAELERAAARATFEEIGAVPPTPPRLPPAPGSELTSRELEVLERLADGATNRAIASELVLSVRTVDRHVSNIFAKLGVSSRAAAVSRAHADGLLGAHYPSPPVG